MSTIFIVGYMASGKTTLGRALARQLGREFIDLDFYIEQRFRKSIKQIFAESGEDGFRRLESNMLREAGEFEDVVISCGGGTPCHFDNMDYMNSRGITIWLQASVERTMERIMLAPGKRPLVADKDSSQLRDYIEKHLKERTPFYSKASLHFTGENLESREQIAQSATLLKRLLKSS